MSLFSKRERFPHVTVLAVLLAATLAASPSTLKISTSANITAQVSVPVTSVIVDVVVLPKGVWDYTNHHLMAMPDALDLTPAQLAQTVQQIKDAGFSNAIVRAWLQPVQTTAYPKAREVKVGMVLVDLGAPAQAADAAKRLQTLNLQLATNAFARVDCTQFSREQAAALHAAAHERATQIAQLQGGRAVNVTISPATVSDTAFDPEPFQEIPFCSQPEKTDFWGSGKFAWHVSDATLTKHLEAGIAFLVEKRSDAAAQSVADRGRSMFPFGWYMFPPRPFEAERTLFNGGGAYVAAPGVAEIVTPADAVVVRFRGQPNAPLDQRGVLETLHAAGVEDNDIYNARDQRGNPYIYVRVTRPATNAIWQKLQTAAANTYHDTYGLMRDCTPYQQHAREVALERSKTSVEEVAPLLHASVGVVSAQADWSGASTDASCGADPSTPMATLVAKLDDPQAPTLSSAPWATFWDSMYASWKLDGEKGASPSASRDYVGTAAITPDAFVVGGWADKRTLRYDVIAAQQGETANDVEKRVHLPVDEQGVFNVDTDCEAAAQRALVNAVKIALLDGARIRSLFVKAPEFHNVLCYEHDLIGTTSHSITLYALGGANGAPQVTQAITINP